MGKRWTRKATSSGRTRTVKRSRPRWSNAASITARTAVRLSMPSASAKSPTEIEAASKAGWSSRSSRPRACRRRPSRHTKLGWRTGKSAA
eukprot:13734641-Alexandrium_andersonii.AAC.1